jgi:hypothetical protein
MRTDLARPRNRTAASRTRATRDLNARRPRTRARAATPQRRAIAGGWLQRRQPERSGVKQAFDAVSRTGRRPGVMAGGAALVTAVGALAFRNRDKLSSRSSRPRDEHREVPAPVETAGVGSTPRVERP